MVTFLKFLRVSLIVSNLLCFCLGILLFIFVFLLAGHAPSFSPKLGGWVAGTSLLSITNLVALFYLFNRLKPGVIKSIFTVINVINAIGYVMAFRRISMILNNYGARLSIGPEYAIWVKVLVFLPCFFALLSAFNFLVMSGFINIHKKDKENTSLAEGDTPTKSYQEKTGMIQKFKGKKRYIIASLGLILCLLFFMGAKKYFDTADDVIPSKPISVEWLVEPNLYSVGGFRNGVGWIQREEDGSWELIDGTGKTLVSGFEAEFLGSYDEETGLAFFRNKEGLSGYIDRSGDVVIPAQYDAAFGFYHGMAMVRKEIDGQSLYGVIDRYGNVVVPIIHKSLYIITPELFGIEKDGKWGCINNQGEVVIDFISVISSLKWEYLGFYPYSVERNFVYVLPPNVLSININGKVGLIRTDGTWVLPASYDVVFDGGNGLIGLEKDGKVGFVDAEGKTVIDFKFYGTTIDGISARTKKPVRRCLNDPLYTFSEGLAVVLLSPLPPPPEKVAIEKLLYGVIDTKGNVLFSFKGGLRNLFHNGFGRLWDTHLWDTKNALTLIDRSGDRYSVQLPQNEYVRSLFWESPLQGVALIAKMDGRDLNSGTKYGYLKFKINREVRSNDQ